MDAGSYVLLLTSDRVRRFPVIHAGLWRTSLLQAGSADVTLIATPPMLGVPPKVLEVLSASVPFPKRLGKPDEFGSLVLELCRNTYFNGQNIRLDGGIRMPPR